MSIDFFIGEVGIQNQSIKSYCNEVISGMDQVRTALSQFVIEPSLKGGAYDSSKSYFNSAYIPATKGFTLVCEAMIKANDQFSKDYKSNVDSNSLQEDVLVSYIFRLNSLSTALEELPAGNIFLSSIIENLQNVRQKTDEKLDKLREYNYTSVHIFDELESQLQNLEAGVMMLVEGKAWNQSTGTFSTMGLNLDWAIDINQSWDARDKKKKGFDDEKNKQLEKYDIIRCYDPITKKTTWALEKDGKAVIDPALTKYLNKVGDSLNKSDYSMIEVTPKEWAKRVNDAWKMNGTEYFSGKQYGWSMAGLAHVQDAKGKLDDSGAWDALWSLGFMYGAVKSINNMNKPTVEPLTEAELMKQKILNNINESKKARESSNFKEFVEKTALPKLPKATELTMSETVSNHILDIVKKGQNAGELSRPYVGSKGTNLLIQEIMDSATPVKDASLPNGLRWDVSGSFNGKGQGIWELVVDLDTNRIVHFNFTK